MSTAPQPTCPLILNLDVGQQPCGQHNFRDGKEGSAASESLDQGLPTCVGG